MSTQSSITQQQMSPDVLESPIYQNFEVCLQRYLTWPSSHEIGLALTVETSLLDKATRAHRRLVGGDGRQSLGLVASLGTPRDVVQVAEGIDVEDVREARRQT